MPKIEFLFLLIAIAIPSTITLESTSSYGNTAEKNYSKLESSVSFTESTPTTYSTTWSSLTTLDTPWPSAASTMPSIRPSKSNLSYVNILGKNEEIELGEPVPSLEATTTVSTGEDTCGISGEPHTVTINTPIRTSCGDTKGDDCGKTSTCTQTSNSSTGTCTCSSGAMNPPSCTQYASYVWCSSV